MRVPSLNKRHLLSVSVAGAVAAMWSSSASAQTVNYSNFLGAANINATYYLNANEDVMNDAQSQLDAVGSHTEKLELDQYDLVNTWSASSKYPWNSNWPALNGSTTLVTIAEMAPWTKALSDPAITSYDITTYSPNIPGGGDGTEYWASGINSTQEAAETTSFFNLTKYLMQTYTGTGKSFYLSNWEGDGALVDGLPNGDIVPPPTEVNGMIAWLEPGQTGIDEARSEYASEYPNVHVYGTVEVNHVEAAMEGDDYNGTTGFATMTNDVLPYTNTDYVSYSSYDTQQNTSGTYSYANACAYIAAHLPTTAINGQNTHSEYVGEFGLAENWSGAATVNAMMNNVINTAIADGEPLAFYWEVYSNELNVGYTVPPGGDGQDAPVQGFYFVKPDGTPATAWKTYRGLIAMNTPSLATSGAIERNLKMAYASNFTAPGATLGSAWSTYTDGGLMTVGLTNGQVQMTTVNGSTTPYGQATLNIQSILGRGLNVGEYLQFTLNRQNDSGVIGLSAFGLNHGSTIGSGVQALNVYPNSTYGWTPISYNATNNATPTYNWDSSATTLGLQLTSANGTDATIAYYVNGYYSGSWLYPTTSTSLTNFSLFAQSNTTNAGFGFNNLTIYTTNGSLAPTNYVWDPAKNGSGSGGAGTWDSGTTNDFYNGTSDVVWNYATLGDQASFSGTGGTVTVASAGVTASTLIFNSPNYVLTGGPITLMGNQTIDAANGQVTVNSVIAGNNGLTITGSGSVVLGASNTFLNGLYVNNGGTASFAVDANLGASGQQIILNNGTLAYTGTTTPTITREISVGPLGGTIDLVNSAGTGKLVLNATNQLGGSGTLSKTGPGWLTLYGTNSGTFTGNWNVNGGVIEVDSTSVLGTGSLTINSAGELASAGITLSNNFTLAGGVLGADNGTGTFTGTIGITANSSLRLGNFWSTASQSVNLSGNISGSGSLTTIPAAGAGSSTGTLTLSGNNSSWTGSMVVAAGTVSFGAGNNIGSGGFTLNGGTLVYTGTSVPTLAGPVVLGTNGGALDLVNTGGTGKIVLTGPSSGSGNITLSGPGWLSLYGAGTGTGAWTINSGIVELGVASALGTGSATVNSGAGLSTTTTTAVSNAITLNSGSTLGADFSTTSTGTFSGPIAIGGAFNVQLGNFWSTTSQNVTLSGNITGTGAMTVIPATGASSSTGVLTLSGTNTFTGGIAVNAGTVAFSSDSNLGATGQGVTLNGTTLSYTGAGAASSSRPFTAGTGGATFNVANAAADWTISGTNSLTGSGTISKTGSGAMIVTGANNATGNVTISAGVVEPTAATSLGSGAVTISGELSDGSTTAVANAITVNSGGTIGAEFSSTNTAIYSGAISAGGAFNVQAGNYDSSTSENIAFNGAITGTGPMTITPPEGSSTSTGTVTLNGTNTFTGGLVVNAGSAAFATDSNLGASGTSITLNGGTLAYTGTTAPTITRAISIGANGGTINLVNSAGTGKLVLSGVISGAGAITKSGPGWLTLDGSNTSTGNWTVNGGVIELATNNGLGSGSVTVNSGAGLSTTTTSTVANAITLNGGSTLGADFASTSTGTFSGSIAIGGAFNVQLGNFWSSVDQNVTLSGNITGSGAMTVIPAYGSSSSTGVLTLSGANTFTGGITVNAGTIAFSSDSNLGGSGQGITLNGTTLSYTGAGAATTSRPFTAGTGGATFNVANAAADLTVSGANSLAGSGTITKTGSGAMIVTGANNATGNVTVSAGVIEPTAATSLGSGSVTIANGAELSDGSTTAVANAITVNTGGTIGAEFSGTNTAIYSGAISAGGGFNVQAGNYDSSTSENITFNGAITGTGPMTITPPYGASSSTGTITLAGTNTFSGGIVVNAGTLAFSSDSNLGATGQGITLNGTTLSYTGAGAATTSRPFTAGTGGATFNVANAAADLTVSGTNSLTGSGTITKTGTGAMIVTGANNATGNVTVSAGVLEPTVATSLGSGSVTIGNGGELSDGSTTAVANAITVNSGGTIGAEFATTSTAIYSGAISAGGAFNVQAGNYDGTTSQNITLNGAITGTGPMTITLPHGGSSSTGTITLAGTNTFTGGITVNAGTLAFSSDSNLGATGQGVTLNGTTLSYTGAGAATTSRPFTAGTGGATFNVANAAADLTVSGANSLTGSGTITKTGSGAMIVTGANNATGNVTVSAGVIEPTAATSLGSGSVTVANGAELSDGSTTAVANAITVNTGGTIGAEFSSTNTAIYSGAISAGGGFNVQDGNYDSSTSENITFNGAITGTGPMTIVAPYGSSTSTGTVALNGTNTFTGGLVVNAGSASFATDSNLGASGTGITLNGGTLAYTGTTAPTITRAITMGTNGGTINLVNSAGTGKLVINGTNVITGSGSITKAGPGWLTLYGGNNSTGNWTINAGAVEVGGATVLGSGTVTVNSGAEVSLNTTTAVTNPVVANTGSTVGADFNSTSTGTYNGTITASGSVNVQLGNFWSTTSQNVTLNGNISGSGSLTTTNAAGASSSTGVLTLAGNNSSYSGGIVIPTGTVATSPASSGDNSAFGTGAITLSGGTLALKGQTTPSGTGAAVAAVTASGYNLQTIYASTDTAKYPSGNNTNNTLMDGYFSFFQNGYTPPTGSLNAGTSLSGGLVNTSITSDVTNPITGTHTPFTLQSFTSNSDLQILEGNVGTMTFTSPTAYANLEILADASYGADASPNLKITFTDGTTVNTTFKAYDWSIGTDTTKQNADVFGTTGVDRYSPTQSPGWDQEAYGMYETDIDMTNIGGVNYSYKRVASLTFTADTTNGQDLGRTNIFAVSGSARAMASGGPNQSYDNNVTVSANSTINVSGSLNAYMGNLTIGTDTLTVASSDNTSNPYTLNFQSTTENGSPTFNVQNSSGGGHGTLNLNDGQTGFPTAIVAGTNSPTNAANPSSVFQNFSVIGGTVAFDAHVQNAVPGVTVVKSLLLSGTGKLDLNNNDLIVQNGTLAGITADLQSGSLLSSTVSEDSTGLTALGVILNNDGDGQSIYSSFDGQPVTADDVLVKYTTYGDANLSGVIDGNDFSAVSNGYTNHLTGWQNGDFNDDGVVDGSDYTLMDDAFNAQTSNAMAEASGQVAEQVATPTDEISVGGGAAVPEPGSLSLLGLAGVAMLGRRRRKS